MRVERIRPVKNCCVAMPNPPYNLLPPEGLRVEWSAYWQRRLNEGVIVIVSDNPPQTKKPSKKKEDKE